MFIPQIISPSLVAAGEVHGIADLPAIVGEAGELLIDATGEFRDVGLIDGPVIEGTGTVVCSGGPLRE